VVRLPAMIFSCCKPIGVLPDVTVARARSLVH
jgi:hypothetical protein